MLRDGLEFELVGISNQEHGISVHLPPTEQALSQGDLRLSALLLHYLLKLIADLAAALEAHGCMTAKICDQDVATQLAAECTLILEVFQEEQISVDRLAVLDLAPVQGRPHL